jgi:RNA polymerase sigma factor (sigma-70 family)
MTDNADATPTRRAIEAVWRLEAGTIVGALARRLRDLDLAEEFAQDALVAALEHWPRDGLPANPGAWLMTAAKRRALDRLRHASMAADAHARIAQDLRALEADLAPDVAELVAAARDDDIGDDLLRLMFVACHPLLSPDARVALTLKLVGGLSVPEIARAFLVAEPTVAQRLVRAKRTLADAGVPFEVPQGAERASRTGSVLEAIYLVFNEGHAATAGADWTRPALCDEALRLARVLAGLVPGDAEVHGLLALLELQGARLAARVDAAGRAVLLADQDRRRWDRGAIARGLAALGRACAIAGDEAALGPYGLQAAIAACHARAPAFADTDWPRIVRSYDALLAIAPSPVVALNRAVAVGMADGPAAALAIVDALGDAPALKDYPWRSSVRGDLLERLGRGAEARAEFERAAALTRNERDRALLRERAAAAVATAVAATAAPSAAAAPATAAAPADAAASAAPAAPATAAAPADARAASPQSPGAPPARPRRGPRAPRG